MAQYGRVGGRRRGNAAWQWLIIGFFPGLLCGGVVIFGLALTGVLQGLTSGPTPTPPPPEEIVLVVTATQDPNAPTSTPMVVTATSEPTTEVEDAVMVQPSPTTEVATDPQGDATGDATTGTDTQSTDAGNATVDTSALTPQAPLPTVPANTVQQTTNTVPQALANTISDTQLIEGGVFPLGTTRTEILTAVEECVTRDGGNCDPSYGEDSYPPVDVQLSAYEMETTEVTFGQYVDFLNYLRSQGSDHLSGCGGFICVQTLNELAQESGGVIVFDGATYEVPTTLTNFPVWGVSWYGANTYCETIGRRLPTESEWEYAASGGGSGITDNIYPWGNSFDSGQAKTRIPVDAAQGPVAVGSYSSGLSGLYDMAGNLEEWVADWYQADYYTQLANTGTVPVDPQGPPTGIQKVLRGGSWNTMPFFTRSAHRRLSNPIPSDSTTTDPRSIGFRCAADAEDTSGGAVDPASLGVEVPGTNPTVETPADAAPTLSATQATAPEGSDETSSSETTEGGTSQRG